MANGTLEPKGYRPRLIEERLDALLAAFGCVEITGPKWCGKTWTALSRARSVTRLDARAEREAAEVDPALALIGEPPHLVDEWQEVPEVWDVARRMVDDSAGARGILLLTGSTALPPSGRERVRHSGAGRIARVSMRPMALAESGESTGRVSLAALLDGRGLEPCRAETTVADVARWCCRGGWPANLGVPDGPAAETAAQYVRAALDVNVMEEGRSPATAMALLRALAMNASQAPTLGTLSRDAGGEDGPTPPTVRAYLDLFDRLYLTEPLSGWGPPMRSKARVRTKPKRYFADPSLPAALLGATPEGLLRDTQTLGALFETLVVRDLRAFLSSYPGAGNALSYYRDEKGLEVDCIVESGGRWGAIEVKLSDSKADAAAASLLALRDLVLANPAARGREPAFLAVVVGKGSLAYRRPDGVFVVPAALLGA